MCQYLSYLAEQIEYGINLFFKLYTNNTYLIYRKNKLNEKHRLMYQISVYDLLLFQQKYHAS